VLLSSAAQRAGSRVLAGEGKKPKIILLMGNQQRRDSPGGKTTW